MRSVLCLLLAAPLACFGQAGAPEPEFNLVSLSAQAEREVPNDLLTATLAAESDGADPAQLADATNRKMQAALAAARAYPSVKVRSGNYQTFPRYENQKVAGWKVRQELRVESKDLAAATELIGKLQSSLLVAGMALSVSPEARRKVENDLIAEAIGAFDERARIVREATKSKGYRLRDLQISGGGFPSPQPIFAAAARAAPVAAPAFEAGSSRILITASGTIQLQ